MLKIENTEVFGWEAAIRGMRNPINSWDRSDSGICKGGDNGIGCSNCVHQGCEHSYDHSFQIGKEDYKLMEILRNAGTDHRKFMLNYEVLANIYKSRCNHKLDEWNTFCDWIENLPCSELITGNAQPKEE